MSITIQQALAAVMNDVQAVRKADRNASQGFNFRGIDAVVNAVGPALRTHGVIVMPEVQSYDYDTVEIGKNRTQMGHVRLSVTYRFHGPAGDFLEAHVVGEAMDSGDKATAKAMSVAFRTALLQALALPTDEPDPDASSYERAKPEPKPKADGTTIEALTFSMRNAVDITALTDLGAEAATYDLDPQVREDLRQLFIERKAELGAGVSA